MSGMNWDEITPEERLLAEQAIVNFRELNKAGDAAADGSVLNVCERMAIEQGREFTRRMLETSLHQQAEEVEKKGRRQDRVRAESTSGIADVKPDN